MESYLTFLWKLTIMYFVVLGRVSTSTSGSGSGSFITFVPNDALDGYQCRHDDAMVLKNYKNPTRRLDCLLRCSTNSMCSSVFVSKDTCLGCRKKYKAITGLKIADTGGTNYFQILGVSYHGACNEDRQCDGENQSCLLGQCVCTIGYSYDYNNQACVEHCQKYGRTFQEYPNYRLFGLNMHVLNSLTVPECLEKCWTEFNDICYSVEYKPIRQKCHIATATALSHGEELQSVKSMNYYTRNCEY